MRLASLFCRNGRYYFRTREPADLVLLFSRGIVSKSLGTNDKTKAVIRVKLMAAEMEQVKRFVGLLIRSEW